LKCIEKAKQNKNYINLLISYFLFLIPYSLFLISYFISMNRTILLPASIILPCFLLGFINFGAQAQSKTSNPVRLAVAGITHGHVGWILSRKKPDITLAGIYEPDSDLAQRYAKK